MRDNLKQAILGTPFAQLALEARNKIDLSYAACFQTSDIGGMANDYLATHLITQICAPGKTFIDIGAHIGSVISSVLSKVPTATIIAIEAIPDKANQLRRKFPSAVVHQVALGNSEGDVTFYVDTKLSGYSSLIYREKSDANTIHEIVVRMAKLDSLVDSDTVDSIKIDVEGAELEVLKGSSDTIRRNRPIIMFESGPPANGESDQLMSSQWQFFQDIGYIVIVPNRLAHNDDGLTVEGYCESHIYPRRTTNYMAVPGERRIEYRDRARRILCSE